MIDLTLVVLVVAAALGYRYLTNKSAEKNPQKRNGPKDHNKMPEMEHVPAMETLEFNASKFINQPGTGRIKGVFDEDVLSY
jgi:hypothetical protein